MYNLIIYKSNSNSRVIQEYNLLKDAQEAMREDYNNELQYCIDHGESPTTAYIGTMNAYIVGIKKCQWDIKYITKLNN